MQVINWLDLQPTEEEISSFRKSVYEVVPARKLRQMLVEVILQSFPWQGHIDLIPFYHPSQTYHNN
jgi:hypothetical protein